jgi:hypothetical protein
MPYQAEISRDNPTLFLFLVDQSGSMGDEMDGGRSKSQFVADVLNRTLYTIVINCTRADGVREYFDIAVLGYGDDSVLNGLPGDLALGDVQAISAVADAPARVEDRRRKVDDGAGGVIEQTTKFPIWFDPRAGGGTPMCAALTRSAEIMAHWCDAHRRSYPPTLIHVTDGESTDGDPEQIAAAMGGISTDDGACLIYNLHVTAGSGYRELVGPVIFPSAEGQLSDQYGRLLFRMSSVLPPHVARFAADKGYAVDEGARGLIIGSGPEFIVDFFEISTRPRALADR